MIIAAAAALAAKSGATTPAEKTPYQQHRGYISQGAELVNGTMTVAKAQELCTGLPDCLGFTFQADWDAVRALGAHQFTAQIWLKGTDEWVEHPSHITFVKNLPKCPNVRYMHYRKASHGPYCCDGEGCPRGNDFATESRCLLPAATLAALPHCGRLTGTPLRNVAPAAKAVASSEYPFAENSGPGAANDGVVNASLFHSRCEKGPQWWRAVWEAEGDGGTGGKGGMAITQVVIHNRKDFRARIVGATLRVVDESGAVLASTSIRAARTMYIWTMRPTVRHAKYVEVWMGEETGCLHFSEVEVFGTAESKMAETDFFEQAPPVEDAAAANAAAAAAAAAAATAAAAAANAHGEGEAAAAENAREARAPAPRAPLGVPAAATAHATGRAGRASGLGGAAAAGLRSPPSEEDDNMLWAATTSSLTAMVLLGVQYLFVKARWLDHWE